MGILIFRTLPSPLIYQSSVKCKCLQTLKVTNKESGTRTSNLTNAIDTSHEIPSKFFWLSNRILECWKKEVSPFLIAHLRTRFFSKNGQAMTTVPKSPEEEVGPNWTRQDIYIYRTIDLCTRRFVEVQLCSHCATRWLLNVVFQISTPEFLNYDSK